MDSGADRSRRERRKSRRTYFSRDRFIQFNLVNATSVTASLLTTHVALSTVAPPLNLVLPFQNLSLSLSLSSSSLQVEMVARICWPSVPFNFSSHRNRGEGTWDASWQRQSRLSRISCAEKRAVSSSARILSRLLPRLCSTVGRIGRVRMWRASQWKGGRRERNFNFPLATRGVN